MNLFEELYPKPPDGLINHDIHNTVHREEMIAIANEIAETKIRQLVPGIAKEIYRQTFSDILRGIRYDIETVVNIAFNDGRDIFTSSKARKAVSDAIYNEIVKGLERIEITL